MTNDKETFDKFSKCPHFIQNGRQNNEKHSYLSNYLWQRLYFGNMFLVSLLELWL